MLLALDRYFQAYEKTTPDFVARAWLGERYAGSHAFRGRTTERHHVEIPMAALHEAKGASDLLLAKEGAGRLYYRIGLRYAPADLTLAPLDRGFTVERAYEGVDSPADVKRDADGTWRIRAGARVRVRLTMVAPARRYHVALVDPLPAGLEALNPALATTGSLPEDGGSDVDADRRARPRRPARDRATGGGGRAPGSTTRTCATSASRRSRRCSGRASTPTATWRGRRRPAASWCRRRRPRRCTARRPSAAARPTGWSSSSASRRSGPGGSAGRPWLEAARVEHLRPLRSPDGRRRPDPRAASVPCAPPPRPGGRRAPGTPTPASVPACP